MHITDLHIGEFTTPAFCHQIVKTSNFSKADLILFTGDLFTTHYSDIRSELNILSSLKAKIGVYGVTGNREYEQNSNSDILSAYQIANIHLLMNCHTKVEGINLIGLENTDHPDWKIKLNDTHSGPNVVLSHQPKHIKFIDTVSHPIDLMLCGHTHGGQIRPLGRKMLERQNQPFISGWNKYKNTPVYVNRGAGYTLVPLRFMAPAEIALITINPH